MPSPLSIGLTVALSATGVLAHPLFNGKLISRAEDLLPEYDYVVVGAGASGLTVANRLSEDQNVKVLIIEAGQFDQDEPFVTIPGLAGGAVGTKYDWNLTYSANPQVNNRSVPIPLGKVVGGSTKLNRMVFDRGSQSDYDTWEALGNKGWNFQSILSGFIKSETFTPPTAAIQAEYNIKYNSNNYGTKGYIQSTFSPFFWPTTKNFVNAAKALGIPINDQATGKAFGGYFCPHNLDSKTATRSSAEEAYYASAQKRSNFHLLPSHQVMQILTKKVNGVPKVTGVKFAASAGAASQQTKVNKEAILAAGTLHTPQLLQLSGIGDPSHLASINVSTVVDLPAVGHNLHDHVSLFVLNQLNTTIPTAGALQSNATFAAEARKQYDDSRSGPLTSPTGDFLLFLPLSTYSNATKAILSQAIAAGPSASLPKDVPAEVARGYEAQFAALNKKLEATDAAFLEIIWADGPAVVGLQHPYSRGHVKAASSSIFDAPIADVGFLRNEVDITLLREGLRFARKLYATSAIASLNPTEIIPGPSVSEDKDIDSWIRGAASTLFHPAGTCKMGPRDQGGVVDQHLHVYGVQGLRVVDASAIPMLPAAHTMTTVYSIAEKAAGIIKAGF